MMGLPPGGTPLSGQQGGCSNSNGRFPLFSIPVQKTSRRARRENNIPSTLAPSSATAITSTGIMQQCMSHSPEQRIFDLVIVQIFQQLGMERFRSYKIVRILSHILHLRLRSLCLQMKHAINECAMQTTSDVFLDISSIIKMFLTRSGELSSRRSFIQQSLLQMVRPAFGELMGYLAAQNSWICSLMERLASIPSDVPSQSRRMLPPEALLTLFTTLPRSFRERASSSSSELIDSMMLEPKLSNTSPLHGKLEEHDAEEESVNEEDPNLAIVDESLRPSPKFLSSFFYFRNEFDDIEMETDFAPIYQNKTTSLHSLLEYEAFKCIYPSRSPTLVSPTSPRSALSIHICTLLSSPAALGGSFSPALALHVDPTFISSYFQSYPLAFSRNKASSPLNSNGPKGRGPELSQEEIEMAVSNFFIAPSLSLTSCALSPISLLDGLASSACSYFGLRGSKEMWLGELVSTPGSRRRAHFCRTDSASAHASVIHLSTVSAATASISSTLASTEMSLSIVIRTPTKPIAPVASTLNIPLTKPVPSISASFVASRSNDSFITSRQKKKKRKIKPIRLPDPKSTPVRIVLKCVEERPPLAPIPTIRIKFPLSPLENTKVEVPKIRLKIMNPNAEQPS